MRGVLLIDDDLRRRRRGGCRGLFDPVAAAAVRVPAIVAYELSPLVRDVLRELRDEVEDVEDFKIPFDPVLEPGVAELREGAAVGFLAL